MYIYNPHTTCFVVSELNSITRHQIASSQVRNSTDLTSVRDRYLYAIGTEKENF